MNIRQKKWKYVVSFSCQDDNVIDDVQHFHLFKKENNSIHYMRIMSEDSFPKLLLMMAIAGIDANEVNFNKVSMLIDVEKALADNKISHLQYSQDGSEPKWVTYDE